MTNSYQKPSPLVRGCLALVVKGENKGRTVVCVAKCVPGEIIDSPNHNYQAKPHHVDHWLVSAEKLRVFDAAREEWVIRSDGIFMSSHMMRIDGGKSEFTAEDAFVYTVART